MNHSKKIIILISILIAFISTVYYTFASGNPMEKRINSMTLDEKIGQMLMFGIEGNSVNRKTKGFIQSEHIGGVILTKSNIKSAKQLLQLTNQIKQTNAKNNKTPIFISTDEEGGLISRMPPEIINLPDSKTIGDYHDPDLAYQVGAAIGERVKAFGFNITLAPVLDINSNPKNPIIGRRSFGHGADVVTNMGLSELKGIQSQKVIPVIKHFPGHGDTDVDSHKGLPVIDHDVKRLNKLELIPFKKAIEADADMVMVAHILIPKLDKKNPASLSKKVMTDILRNEMNFNGVVITDDLAMQAITKNGEIGKSAVKSVLAGADILLVNHDDENKREVLAAIKKAINDGRLTEARIDESVYRILMLKEKYKLSDAVEKAANIDKINKISEEIMRELMKW
jgi:beta-N-acetylhexosaminidase